MYNSFGVYYQNINKGDSADYYFHSSLRILDTFKRDVHCLQCWLAARINLLRNPNIGINVAFDIEKGNASTLEDEVGLDSLKKLEDQPSYYYTVYSILGKIYESRNNLDSAVTAYDKGLYILNKYAKNSLADSGYYNEYYNNVGYYMILMGQPQKALNLLKMCFTKYPRQPHYDFANYVNITFAYLFNNQPNKSKRVLDDFRKTFDKKDVEEFKKELLSDFDDYKKRNFDATLLNKFQSVLDNYSIN